MNNIHPDVEKQLTDLKKAILEDLETVSQMAEKDLEIDQIDLDKSLLQVPKLQSKWSKLLADETLVLKDLYAFKENVKLERWKYYNGKQTDQYIAQNGIIHEKILKTDIDKYLAADVKLTLVNEAVSAQKEKVDFIERTLKELTNRGFHVRSIIDWRRFVSGA